MFYLTYIPGPPLSEFVDYFWLFDGGQTPRKERIVPSGTNELVINLRDDEIRIDIGEQSNQHKLFSGAVLSGTYSSMFVIDAMQHESMLGVHFKSGGAFPFIGALTSELTNSHADLVDLWGRSALELRERLCAVSTPLHRFQIMEEVLRDRLRCSRKGHLAVAIALNEFGPSGRALRSEMSPDRSRYASGGSARFLLLKLASLPSSSAASRDFNGCGPWRIRSRNLIGHR